MHSLVVIADRPALRASPTGRPVVPQERLLHDVLSLGDAAEHPVGAREQQRPHVSGRLGGGHVATGAISCRPRAKPSLQLGQARSQRSSRLALAFDEPRTCVIIETAASPAASRPSQAGIRSGDFAPTSAARAGSHSLTGAGSSSTMLKTPVARLSSPATPALAASWTCRNDQIPAPLPMTGT